MTPRCPEPLLAWIEQRWAEFEQENPTQSIITDALRTNGMAPRSHEPLQGDLFQEGA